MRAGVGYPYPTSCYCWGGWLSDEEFFSAKNICTKATGGCIIENQDFMPERYFWESGQKGYFYEDFAGKSEYAE
jgi:hypothetical protein